MNGPAAQPTPPRHSLRSRRAAGAAAGSAVLAVLLWIAAEGGLGMAFIVPRLVERSFPEGWTVSVGSVEGSWLSRIRARDVEVRAPDLRVDLPDLTVRYRLLPLLRRTVELEDVRVDRPAVEMALPASSSGEADESASPFSLLHSSPLGPWRLRLHRASVTGGRVRVGLDGRTHEAAGVTLAGALALDQGGLDLRIDSAAADVVVRETSAEDPEARMATTSGRFELAASVEEGLLELRRLSFVTTRSRLEGGGSLDLRPTEGRPDTLAFSLTAQPLDLRDLPLRLPEAMRADPRVEVEARAWGTADSVRAEVRVRGPGDAAAEIVATVRAPFDDADAANGEGPPALTSTLRLDGFALAGWSPPPLDGTLAARVEATLERLEASAPLVASGTLEHRPDSAAEASLLGRPLRVRVDVSAGTPPEGSEGMPSDRPLRVDLRLAGADAAGGWTDLGEAEARAAERRADWRVALAFDSGSVRASGSADWRDSVPRLGLDRVETRRLDLASLGTGLPETRITGLLKGRVEGRTPETLAGRLALDLAPSTFAGTPLDTLSAGADVRGGVARGALLAAAPSGRARFDYRTELRDSVLRVDASDVRVDAGDSTATGAAQVALRGGVAARWRIGPGPAEGSLVVRVDSGSVGSVTLASAEARARIRGDSVRGDARLEGGLSRGWPLRARATLAGALPTGGADPAGRVELAAYLPWTAEPVPLAGGTGPTRAGGPDRLAGAADSLVATLEARPGGLYTLDGSLHPAEGGLLLFDGQGTRTPDETTFALSARGGLDGCVRLLEGGTIDSLLVDVSGRRAGEGRSEFVAEVAARGGAWGDVVADTMRIVVRSDSLGLKLDTLRIASNVVEVDGSGALPVGGRDRGLVILRAVLGDVDPLRGLVGAEVLAANSGTLEMTATGSLDSTRVEAGAALGAVVWGDVRMAGIEASGRALLSRAGEGVPALAAGALDLTLDRVSLPDTEVRSVAADVDGGRDSLRVELTALVDDARRGDALLHLDLRPEGRAALVERVRFQLDRDEWRLERPARVSWRDGVRVDSFAIQARRQRIEIDGGVDGAGALGLSVRVDSTDIGTVSDLAGLPGLEGWVGGTLRLEGTTVRPEGRLSASGGFHRAGDAPGRAEILVEGDGRRVRADVGLRGPHGGTLHLDGTVPLPPDSARRPGGRAAAEPVADTLGVTLAAEGIRISWLLPFVDPEILDRLDGRLEGAMTVSGSLEEPSLGGAMVLREGAMRIRPLGVDWESLRVHARGEGRHVVIDSARTVAGTGTARLSGRIEVADSLPLDLEVALRGFRAIRSPAYWATVSGRTGVAGNLLAPALQGELSIESLDVFLDERVVGDTLEAVELTEEDLRMLRERFGYVPERRREASPLVERLRADLTVEIGRDSWLRKRTAPEMAVPFTGRIDVTMRPGEPPALDGSVEVIPRRGFVKQFGRRFEVAEGTVTFDGPPATARVDLAAEYTVPSYGNPDDAEVTILLRIEGRQEELRLTFSSDPTMENADIVSYIATGRPASGSLSFEGGGSEGGLVAAGADFALERVTGLIEGAAQRSVGLDVVEIRREGLRQATLVAGKYVSPRLYVGFAQPITLREGDGLSLGDEGESEVEIELSALRWLIINIEGSGSALRLFLRGRHAY